eukprot:scaffold174562_cov37-Prasinocladus_malaysianus.AAC.1
MSGSSVTRRGRQEVAQAPVRRANCELMVGLARESRALQTEIEPSHEASASDPSVESHLHDSKAVSPMLSLWSLTDLAGSSMQPLDATA